MQAIEKESGINRALVHYYFGSKAGLVDALVESCSSRIPPSATATRSWRRRPAKRERARRCSTGSGASPPTARSARLLYELLPHILRSKSLRDRVAELYGAYREFDGDCLASGGPADAELREDLGALSVAVVEGLGIQSAVDPHGFERDRAYALWQDVILTYLSAVAEAARARPRQSRTTRRP